MEIEALILLYVLRLYQKQKPLLLRETAAAAYTHVSNLTCLTFTFKRIQFGDLPFTEM
jgi:hypothetical protein